MLATSRKMTLLQAGGRLSPLVASVPASVYPADALHGVCALVQVSSPLMLRGRREV